MILGYIRSAVWAPRHTVELRSLQSLNLCLCRPLLDELVDWERGNTLVNRTREAVRDSSFPAVKSAEVVSEKKKRIARAFVSNPQAMLGAVVLLIVVVSALLAPQLAPADRLEQNLRDRLQPPVWVLGGNWEHPLGTDQLGRDILARLLYGGRVSLSVGFVSATLGALIGIPLGMLAGYYEGAISNAIMRIVDIQLALPFIITAIAIIATFGANMVTLFTVLSLWGWSQFARVARGDTLSIAEREYIMAARASGATTPNILFRHILPNLVSPLIVVWTVLIAQLIIAESGLSFLGLGTPPPEPSWGSMLADGRAHISKAWWLATFPGMIIMLTVLAVNQLGDGLRDVLDPRLRQ